MSKKTALHCISENRSYTVEGAKVPSIKKCFNCDGKNPERCLNLLPEEAFICSYHEDCQSKLGEIDRLIEYHAISAKGTRDFLEDFHRHCTMPKREQCLCVLMKEAREIYKMAVMCEAFQRPNPKDFLSKLPLPNPISWFRRLLRQNGIKPLSIEGGEMEEVLASISEKLKKFEMEVKSSKAKEILVEVPEKVLISLSFHLKGEKENKVKLKTLLSENFLISNSLKVLLRILREDLSPEIVILSQDLVEVIFKGCLLRMRNCLEMSSKRVNEALANSYSSKEELEELKKSLY